MGRALLLFAIVALVGCRPEIGDECTTSVDCSPTGDRLCDTTQLGGYCTIFNCEPDTCPDEAACVEFAADPSTLLECRDPHGTTRYQRSFCLKACEDDSDCRDDEGYVCTPIGLGQNEWGAIGVDEEEPARRVCTRPYQGKPLTESAMHATEVCTGTSQTPGTAGNGGTSGNGGMSGNGGASGADAGEGGSGGESGQAGGAGGG